MRTLYDNAGQMTIPDSLNVRKKILGSIKDKRFSAAIKTDMAGILAGVEESRKEIVTLGLEHKFYFPDGDSVKPEDTICILSGFAEDIIKAEEIVMGKMAKASGIATATNKAVKLADGECKIVAGAWKKMPGEIKSLIQQAVRIGGASTRLIEDEFIYLDKNYIQMFGGIRDALAAVSGITDRKKVVQLKGREGSIEDETVLAIENGADIIMVDTGKIDDLIMAANTLTKYKAKKSIKVGFASDLKIKSIPEYSRSGADFLCIGKDIVDAPLLDMRLDVVRHEESRQ